MGETAGAQAKPSTCEWGHRNATRLNSELDELAGESANVVIDRNGLFGEHVQMMLPQVIRRDAVYVGRSLYTGCPSFAGRISEVILYARALSDAEVQNVHAYLQKKYACCGLLPSK